MRKRLLLAHKQVSETKEKVSVGPRATKVQDVDSVKCTSGI